MRLSLVFWLLLFILGVFVGDRYGLPSWASSLGDRGFSVVEGWFGRINEPIPEAVEADNAADASGDADDGQTETATPASGELGNADNSGLRINNAGLHVHRGVICRHRCGAPPHTSPEWLALIASFPKNDAPGLSLAAMCPEYDPSCLHLA